MDFTDFSGYILAGGKSSRMGTDKAFLKIGEKTFIENSFEILKPVCETRVKVILNNSQKHFIEKLPPSTPHIFDIYENRGALGGIHAGLRDCKTEFAVVLAVDLPFVTSKIVKELAEKILLSSEFSAIIPKQANSKLQPLCGVYKKNACLPVLENLLKKHENFAVHEYLDILEIKIIEQNNFQIKSDVFFNVNNSSDYKKVSGQK